MSKKKQQSIINKLSKIRIPDLLFHYTTSAGLTGIIETGKIWLTKIQYTNDKNELCLALEQIRTEIDLQGQGIEKTRREEELDAMGKALHEAPTVNVGVASFTKEGDQLSQWRGYCEIGKGYSLGFDGQKLKDVVCQQAGYHLLPCIYKLQEHKQFARELVDHYPTREAWNHALGNRSGDLGDLYEFELAFSSSITSFAPLIKSEKFKEEREWRLISPILSYTGAKFRTGNHVLIPYWEFDLDVGNTLRKIVVGPTPEPELSHLAVRGLLIRNGLPGVAQEINIVSSKISLKKV